MTHADPATLVTEGMSALLFVGLGAAVLTLESRRRRTTLLGAFAILLGLKGVGETYFDLVHTGFGVARVAYSAPFAVATFVVLLALVASVPTRLEDRRPLWAALAVGLGLRLALVGHMVAHRFAPAFGVPVPTGAFLGLLAVSVTFETYQVAILLCALRARPGRGTNPSGVTQLAILSVALATLSVGAFGGGQLVPEAASPTAGQPLQVFAGLLAGSWLVVAGFWGWNMLRASRETVRVHRAVTLGILGLVAAGAVYGVFFPGELFGVMRGVMRTLGVGLLAYGVLRHDLAGLDEKVEFGVSRTTVAGVFVAVFFVVSEGAQALFADFAGNEFLGVLAAGALVFVISPLQRLADRFAARAVPGGAEAGADAEARYRAVAEMALADGEIDREEERRLAEQAAQLGIDADRAFELRDEVRTELEGEDADGGDGP